MAIDNSSLPAFAILGAVLDVALIRSGHRSFSGQVWDLLDRPIAGPVAAGALGGFFWHLLHRPRGH